jgi:hypothetical protein
MTEEHTTIAALSRWHCANTQIGRALSPVFCDSAVRLDSGSPACSSSRWRCFLEYPQLLPHAVSRLQGTGSGALRPADAQRWRAAAEATPGSHWRQSHAAILFLLTSSVGLPYFGLSATSPPLQSRLTTLRGKRSPYFALSNATSLLALLAYPVVIRSSPPAPRWPTGPVATSLWSA